MLLESSVESVLLICMFLSWTVGGIGAVIFHKNPGLANYIAYGGALFGSAFGLFVAVRMLLLKSVLNVQLWSVIPPLTFSFSLDALSAFFLFLIAIIALIVSIYAPSYMVAYKGLNNVAFLGAGFNLFLLSMAGVVMAQNGFTFLVMWEMMSLVSFFLVIFEHEKREVRKSSIFYIIMTHIATGFIILAFLLLYLGSGSLDFSVISAFSTQLPVSTKHIVFVAAMIGFGTKAGLFPLHSWLPRAHPVAPTHISALMSAVMIKTALYGIIRVVYDFLGVVSIWWGISVLIIGIISAIYGILYGAVQQNVKRFLAYSSVENMGLIFIGLGASFIFAQLDMPLLAGFALLASLYHALNHAFFKGLLFMGAGAVYYSTGIKNMEHLGGLIRSMPYTAGLFLVGSLAIASFPPFNGFISKWLTFQALLNLSFFSEGNVWLNILGITGVVTLIFVGALVGLGFVKLFGAVFLAQPRTERAEKAKEVPLMMRLSMGLMAIGIICLGIFPGFIVGQLNTVTSMIFPDTVVDGSQIFTIQSTMESSASINPVYILLALIVVFVIALTAILIWVGKSNYEKKEPWGCGISLRPDMSYSGMSLSHPLLIIFKPFFGESNKLLISKQKVMFFIQPREVLNNLFYDPLVRFIMMISSQIRKIQNGSIHSYLAYIFLTLIIFLIVVTIN